MVSEQFAKAEMIKDRVGAFPLYLSEHSITDLLTGIDHTCRPLQVVFTHSFGEANWGRLDHSRQQELRHAYSSLMLTSEVVRAEARMMPPSFLYHRLDGDLLDMAKAGTMAQNIATILADRFDLVGKKVDPQSVAVMAMTAVRAVAAWAPDQQFFSDEHEAYYSSNFEDGLNRIDRCIWPTG